MGGYSKKDAAKDTDSSTREVSRAHHQARDDSGVRQGRDRDNFREPPSWAERTTSSGTSLFPDRGSGDSGK